jgi:hypothetical protein
MEMRGGRGTKRVVLLTAFAVCACLVVAAVAWAEESLTIKASFSPDKLGAPTTLSASATFGSTTGGPQSPVTKVTAYGPAGMSVDVRGAGTCTATVAKLEEVGPSACPADSRIGFGRGTALMELAKEIIRGPFTLDFFLAPSEHGHLVMLVYASAVTPASVQLVLVAREVPAPKPYGFGISYKIPIIPNLPGATLGWEEQVLLTFGSTNVAYYKTVHGKRKLFHVRGIVVPKKCPRGGFPVEGQVEFADGATSTAKSTIPCPRR